MKRERTVQVVLILVGLLYLTWAYITFDNLWHLTWLQKHQDSMPMFTSLNAVLGVFLLLAVKEPAKHRSLIAYGAWSSLAHAFTMAIMSVEAWSHGMHRQDGPFDIVFIGAIGVLLLVVLPAKEPSTAGTEKLQYARTAVQLDPPGA